MSIKKIINIDTFSCRLDLIISDNIAKDINILYKKYNADLPDDYNVEEIGRAHV